MFTTYPVWHKCTCAIRVVVSKLFMDIQQKWSLLKDLIESFKLKYPLEWKEFVERNKIEATQGAKSEQGHLNRVCSFPVVWDNNKEEEASLLDGITKIFPEILDDDSLLKEFLKRHPEFKNVKKLEKRFTKDKYDLKSMTRKKLNDNNEKSKD